MSRADGILSLVLTEQPWLWIKDGRKPVEYRELSDYWVNVRGILLPIWTHARLQWGYKRDAPQFILPILRTDIGPTDPRWTFGIVTAPLVARIWFREIEPLPSSNGI